jgi:Fic family protein
MAFDTHHKITEEDIKKVHLIIAERLVPHSGEYRQSDDYRDLGAEFTPPPFYEIPQHTSELVEFINENPDVTPVELAAHAHYHLAWIHPFENVNGRTTRLLLNFILIKNRYPFIIIKDVERKKYRHTLNLADNGDLGPFLEFTARSAEQTLDTYPSTISRLINR